MLLCNYSVKFAVTMFCLNDTMRYFPCPGKTDMRKDTNSLCGVIHDKMGYDARLGDVFIFYVGNKIMLVLQCTYLTWSRLYDFIPHIFFKLERVKKVEYTFIFLSSLGNIFFTIYSPCHNSLAFICIFPLYIFKIRFPMSYQNQLERINIEVFGKFLANSLTIL